MRVAALYDIHGNLPALEAVLEEVASARVDMIVVGGDVVPGPMPRECLERLLALATPVQFIHGNCERAVLAQMAAPDPASVTYWGTVTGRPLPEPLQHGMRWTAQQLRDYEGLLAAWPRTLQLAIDGLGAVLFCHATPRSETEVFTRATPDERLRPIVSGLDADVLVCGHTHMPFDRRVGRTRILNPGSVGAPFGERGAGWALLGPDVGLRRTTYDLERAAQAFRATDYPQAMENARELLDPPTEAAMIQLYATVELQ